MGLLPELACFGLSDRCGNMKIGQPGNGNCMQEVRIFPSTGADVQFVTFQNCRAAFPLRSKMTTV